MMEHTRKSTKLRIIHSFVWWKMFTGNAVRSVSRQNQWHRSDRKKNINSSCEFRPKLTKWMYVLVCIAHDTWVHVAQSNGSRTQTHVRNWIFHFREMANEVCLLCVCDSESGFKFIFRVRLGSWGLKRKKKQKQQQRDEEKTSFRKSDMWVRMPRVVQCFHLLLMDFVFLFARRCCFLSHLIHSKLK